MHNLRAILRERFMGIPLKEVDTEEEKDKTAEDTPEIDSTDTPEDELQKDQAEKDGSNEDNIDGDLGGDLGDSGPDLGGGGGSLSTSSDSPIDDSEPAPEDMPEDKPEDTADKAPEQPQEQFANDDEKITSLYTDTGDRDFDYSLSNPSNVRLAKFKFKNAGIDIANLLDTEEISTGVPSNDLENRLSPQQRSIYSKKNKELRKKWPLIDVREKNIIIYNSNVPFLKIDPVTGEEVELEEQNITEAYKKLNDYLTKKYGQFWQDNEDIYEFLQSIKINFTDKNSIRVNLVRHSDIVPLTEDDSPVVFDKVGVTTPKPIDKFLRDNLKNELFVKSNIFHTLVAGYLNANSKSNSIYPIVSSEDLAVPGNMNTTDTQDTSTDSASEPDTSADPSNEPTPEDTSLEDIPEITL
jgi:hypothetical protein